MTLRYTVWANSKPFGTTEDVNVVGPLYRAALRVHPGETPSITIVPVS